MQKQINKKIILYLFIFILLGTLSNKNLLKDSLKKNYNLEIISLSNFDDEEIIKELSIFRYQNLFFLKKNQIFEILNKHKIVEELNIFKNYPSKLNIEIRKTKFLAVTKKNGVDFYIGSNGNLIKVKEDKYDQPFIFGDVEVVEFLKLKRLIDNSNFNFFDIKNFFYFKSKRWDIEMNNGLLIKLPLENLSKSFEILSTIINKKDSENINYIDLRQKNQIILNG
tara:strand:+ start:339 stop:1010 length:672 start_codon:yes stop_codon:yes gene_type:complete